MGNEEQTVKEESNSESQETKEAKTEEVNDSDSKNEKKNTEEIRKVIKVNSEEKKEEKDKAKNVELEDTSREGLEQKRAILQSIKDFDFQIKKNQEDITGLNQKLDSVSKDLDDLVSLYEIVSEQMNPFVGLSKVTKKRIDALENFTKEVEDLKTRIGDLESFAEMAGANLQEIRTQRGETPQIESENIQKKSSSESTPNVKITPMMSPTQDVGNGDLDLIIERAFDSLSLDNEIDNLINEFIENLKGMN